MYNDSFAEGIFISSSKDKWDCFFVSCYIVLKKLLACRCEFEVVWMGIYGVCLHLFSVTLVALCAPIKCRTIYYLRIRYAYFVEAFLWCLPSLQVILPLPGILFISAVIWWARNSSSYLMKATVVLRAIARASVFTRVVCLLYFHVLKHSNFILHVRN